MPTRGPECRLPAGIGASRAPWNRPATVGVSDGGGLFYNLLVLLSDGLTEGRLTSLLRRWSKRGAERLDERAMDDDDGD